MIEQQVRHLCRLVDDLLDVSRITRGKIQLRTRAGRPGLDRHPGRRECPPADRAASPGADAPAARRPGPAGGRPDPDRADPRQPPGNASKYTDPGGSIVLAVDRDGDEVGISVRDDGIGIAPEMLPHGLRPLRPGRPSLDRSQGGLGIGLTLVRSLVQMHGGTVEVRSEGLGRGSEFIVRLPPGRRTTSCPSRRGRRRGRPRRRVAPGPDRRRQRPRRREPGDGRQALEPRRPGRLRRPRGHRAGRGLPAPGRPARHRPARDGRLRVARTLRARPEFARSS